MHSNFRSVWLSLLIQLYFRHDRTGTTSIQYSDSVFQVPTCTADEVGCQGRASLTATREAAVCIRAYAATGRGLALINVCNIEDREVS